MFTDGAAARTTVANPEIDWVSVAYQPENVAPVIDDIVIQDPNVRVQGFAPAAPMPGNATPVQLKMPQRAGTPHRFFP